ncbi:MULTISPECIES: hypothetical protein [unclassified Sedimentibacter]|uniref:hypothetical protein n=1 Tax=unclassified Sedimentibacter TaxID=2649220 RepID=UPI0027DF2746|nr:hypothetical protein [Sedimentibacter sp. MB35-C1]WMJ77091.1 hypothetical protein RBQ61_16190 [Sedimentibacter sp. MB35-C1]
MKYKMLNVKDLATIAMCVAIAVVLGKVVGVFHKILPFSRGVINAPFFSFIIAMMLYKVRKPVAVSLFAVAYGFMMARMSIFATISIAAGGIVADIIISIILRDFKSDTKIAIFAPIYSVCGIIATFIMTTFFIKSSLYSFGGTVAVVISAVSVYGAGAIGAFFAMKLYQTRLSKCLPN